MPQSHPRPIIVDRALKVDLVHLVYLILLVGLVQANKRDKPNKRKGPAGPLFNEIHLTFHERRSFRMRFTFYLSRLTA
jgi:hypothetical protein